MRAQLLLQATMSALLEQLYVCVRQERRVQDRSFSRLWRWRGEYRVAHNGIKNRRGALAWRCRRFFGFLRFGYNVRLLHK